MSRRSTIVDYVLSFISIALLSCCLLGVTIVQAIVGDYNRAIEESSLNRLSLAADDMIVQLDSLYSIAYKPQLNAAYQRVCTNKNRWYEIALCEELPKYLNQAALEYEYFIFRPASASVYRSTGTKLPCQVYSKQILHTDFDMQTVFSGMANLRVVELEDSLVFAWPLRAGAESVSTLGFVVSKAALTNRLREMAGGMAGGFLFVAPDGQEILLGESLILEDESLREAAASGSFGKFKVCAIIRKNELALSGVIRLFNPFWAAVTVAVILILAIVAAWRVYVPIRKLEQSVTKDEARGSKNELKNIERAFSSLSEQGADADRRLREELAYLRHQLLEQLLQGHCAGDMRVKCDLVNISLRGEWFGVVALRLAEGERASDEFLMAVEQLSGETMRLYCLPDASRPNRLSVLVIAQERWMLRDARELTEALAEELNLRVNAGCGSMYGTPNKLPISMMEAELQLKSGLSPQTGADERMRETVSVVRAAIGEGRAERANAALAAFMESVSSGAESEIYRRFICMNLLGELIPIARGTGLDEVAEEMMRMTLIRDMTVFEQDLYALIKRLCEGVSKRLENGKSELVARALDMIREQCFQPNLSLESIADALKANSSYLSRMIKEVSGKNYKEHLFIMRMERAEALLRQSDLSVSEISAQVGFLTVSNFIARFKEHYGMTPGAYRQVSRGAADAPACEAPAR